jgi:transposase-like protein
MKSLSCPNRECALSAGTESIIRHGFYNTNSGKRRRYRCRTCGKTFSANTGTPYHRLQHRRTTFDEVATLSVEGLNKSAIARVKQIAWNTVARWLEKAAHSCRRLNDRNVVALSLAELQADEIRTVVGSKKHPCLSPIIHRPQSSCCRIKELPGSLIRKKLRIRLGMQTNLENPLHQQTLIRFSPR